MPQNSIYTICRDHEGFIWFGTADGLCRYDGNGMKIFRNNPDDTNSLPGNFIRRLLVDSKGNIWIGTENGICCYNPAIDQNRRIHLPGEKNFTDVAFPYCEMPDGKIFFGTTLNRFYEIDPNSFKTEQENFTNNIREAFLNTSIYTIFFCNPLLVFSVNNSIAVYNTRNKEFNLWPVTDPAFKNATDVITKGDSIYVSNYHGIIVMNVKDGKYRQVEKITIMDTIQKLTAINTLQFSPQGNLLIGVNDNGLIIADKFLQTARQYIHKDNDPNSLSFNTVRSLYYDPSGNLWIGTDGKGLNKCSVSKRFTLFNIANNGKEFLSGDFVRCFADDDAGNLYIGTYGGGLNILNKARTKSEIFRNDPLDKNSLPSNNVLCMYSDSRGFLWLGTDKGVLRFDKKKNRFEKVSGNETTINSLIEVSPGKILAATNELSFYFNSDSGLTAKTFNDSTLLHAANFYRDKADNFYVAINRKYFDAKKTKFKSEKNEFGNFYCFAETQNCYADMDGTVWTATKTGLAHWTKEGKLLKNFTDRDGLPDNYLYSILSDNKGNLWISSNNGISKFNIQHSSFRNYDISDGLQANEFNSNAAYISKDGEFLFGGINGFNSFYPDSIIDNQVVPSTVITSCKVFNKEWKGDSSVNNIHLITLPYFENTITFTLASLEFTQPEQNLISYRLLGLDTVWASLGTERVINFMGLSPGDYVLEVKSCNNDGVWNSVPKKLAIHIIPPVWKTTWFLSLAVFIFLFVVVLIVRYLARKKLKKQLEEIKLRNLLEKERTRISQDMHDEIGSGLSKISILSELAGNKNMLPSEREEQMNKITSTSRQLVDNIQEIIWSLNPRNDTLVGLLSYMHEYANEYFDSTSINLHFEYPVLAENETIHLKNTIRRNIFLAFKETLNNIVKHSGATNVNIVFSFEKSVFQITVSDNGKGIAEADFNKNRNGLQNMKLRMKECEGDAEIKSEQGSGTTIKFRIKLEKEMSVTT